MWEKDQRIDLRWRNFWKRYGQAGEYNEIRNSAVEKRLGNGRDGWLSRKG